VNAQHFLCVTESLRLSITRSPKKSTTLWAFNHLGNEDGQYPDSAFLRELGAVRRRARAPGSGMRRLAETTACVATVI
jgi:hypothetical protein